jgi:hypothetical protein
MEVCMGCSPLALYILKMNPSMEKSTILLVPRSSVSVTTKDSRWSFVPKIAKPALESFMQG